MSPRGLIPLLLVMLAGCVTSARTVRLETGRGGPILHTPRTDTAPVELDNEVFKKTVQTLGRNVTVSSRPRKAALRLLEDSYPGPRQGRVTVEPPSRAGLLEPEDTDLTGAYLQWCQRQRKSNDCLYLLEGGLTLDEEGKRVLAFRFAIDSVWDETAEALEDLTDRDAMMAMLATTGVVYLGLWMLPEPVSKGVAALITLGLIGYLGWDTVWSLIQGWRVLASEVKAATSFGELQDAGERYGKVLGQQAARAFIMLAMAALGSTAQTLATKIPTLPGSAQAALVGAEQGGFRLAGAGQVVSVEVASGGVVTIALDPGAVAISAAGTAPVDTEGHEHHIATNKWKDATHSGGPWTPKLQKLFDRAGMSLDDSANRVRVPGHKGPHPREYHEEVYRILDEATTRCGTIEHCRAALTKALKRLAKEINTPDTRLNKWVTRTE